VVKASRHPYLAHSAGPLLLLAEAAVLLILRSIISFSINRDDGTNQVIFLLLIK